MADAPTERKTTREPYNRGREDTVVRPMPVGPPSPNGQPSGSSGSNGEAKVLPPMPAQAPPKSPPKTPAKTSARKPVRKPAAKKSAAKSAAPAQAPSKAPTKPPPSRPPTAKAPGPKPSAPPTQAVAAAAAAAAPAVPAAAPAPAPAQAPAPAPAQPKVKTPKPAPTPKPAKPAKERKPPVKVVKEEPRPGRRARLRMTRIDPWSVMKTAFLLSIALGVVTVVSVFMVWSVLDAAEVWESINATVRDVVGGQSATSFDIEDYIGTRRIVGFAMIVAAVDVVLLTAIATLGAFLYNMSASLLGGIEVTLAEDK